MMTMKKKCNLTLKWAHLPISLNTSNSLTGICQQGVPLVKPMTFGPVTFGQVWISVKSDLVNSQTDRKWCIRAHRAYAQVGSKTSLWIRQSHPLFSEILYYTQTDYYKCFNYLKLLGNKFRFHSKICRIELLVVYIWCNTCTLYM